MSLCMFYPQASTKELHIWVLVDQVADLRHSLRRFDAEQCSELQASFPYYQLWLQLKHNFNQ